MSTITSTFLNMNDLGARAGDTIARQFDTVFRTVMRGPAVTSGREFFRYITNEPHPFGNFVRAEAVTSAFNRHEH